MVEKSLATQEKPVVFNELLSIFASNMRAFDAITEKIKQLHADRESFESYLKLLDLELPVECQLEEFGNSALSKIIIDKKIEKLNTNVNDLQLERLDILHIQGLYGEKLQITAIDPDNHEIGSFIRNEYGQLDGTGKFHESRKGKVVDIGLNPAYDGWIQIEGRFGKVYQATPLIDRENDYSACFEIVTLD